ncbi:MAG: ABC transporter permease subunit [Clostridiales bacterium]|nr:ABC transporter permease subunit [Clostridiales bacterium]
MKAVFKREFLSFFRTPIGYVFIGVFAALSGVIFYLNNVVTLSGELLIFLSQLTLLLMLLSPLLTMRLLNEETRRQSEKLLLSSPAPLPSIVLGKFLAAAAVMMIAILLTNVCTLIMAVYGTVFAGEWFVGYLGLILQAMSFLAIDMFLTCFAQSQASAALLAFAGNLVLWMMDLIADAIAVPAISKSLRFLSLYDRYEPFILGQLSYSSIAYFTTFTILFVIATMRLLDARRFSQGGVA